jgi:hypothetical protein
VVSKLSTPRSSSCSFSFFTVDLRSQGDDIRLQNR